MILKSFYKARLGRLRGAFCSGLKILQQSIGTLIYEVLKYTQVK